MSLQAHMVGALPTTKSDVVPKLIYACDFNSGRRLVRLGLLFAHSRTSSVLKVDASERHIRLAAYDALTGYTTLCAG